MGQFDNKMLKSLVSATIAAIALAGTFWLLGGVIEDPEVKSIIVVSALGVLTAVLDYFLDRKK